MPATSDLLNRPCVSEEMAKLAHQRWATQYARAAFLDGVRAAMAESDDCLWMRIEAAVPLPEDTVWLVILSPTEKQTVFARPTGPHWGWFADGRWNDEAGKALENECWRVSHVRPVPAPPRECLAAMRAEAE